MYSPGLDKKLQITKYKVEETLDDRKDDGRVVFETEQPDLRSNPGRRFRKSTTECLSYDTIYSDTMYTMDMIYNLKW
jgi:hypothetical protein